MLAWCSAPSPGLSQPLVSASRLSNSRRYSGCIEASNSQELLTLPARMWCCVNAKTQLIIARGGADLKIRFLSRLSHHIIRQKCSFYLVSVLFSLSTVSSTTLTLIVNEAVHKGETISIRKWVPQYSALICICVNWKHLCDNVILRLALMK